MNRLLIANRGEIACRIARTARKMGIATVAVYSDADAGAAHVAACNSAYRIGPAPAAESYLNGPAVLEAAAKGGAQAIHPGYGFLSENPEFVEAVEAAGLIFVGPSAKAIRAMGLKDEAKALMTEAGVPVVPGYQGELQDPAHLAAQAATIGYPVLIKAVAGGGGKGMRRVDRPEDFAAFLQAAQREAKAAFGNDRVLIEKFITSPRHIEMQVFGDGTRAIHLYERDCSLQRRHQKVIEEAPAPGMTSQVREAMGTAAVRAAEAIGYSGAGTVEFIVDGSGPLRPAGFWFMEMNTRLQVEHPVTEAITGIDLVEWQLRVAAGEPLPMTQDQVPLQGHAVEARVYAEDPARGFLPAVGTLDRMAFPGYVRVDSGVRAGDEITPHYDPMIAKVIAHSHTRHDAIKQLQRALAAAEITGSVTNTGFLVRLLDAPAFLGDTPDTGLIDRELEQLTAPPAPNPASLAAAALAALDLPRAGAGGFTLWSPLVWTAELSLNDALLSLTLSPDGSGYTVSQGEVTWHLRHARRDGDYLLFELDGAAHRVFALARETRITLRQDGQWLTFDRPDPLASGETGAGGDQIVAPMPGLVRASMVTAGQTVSAGEALLVLEAMKMEHPLSAPRDGIVAAVHVAEGAQVADADILVELEPQDD